MKETEVLIETSLGDIKVKLYNETPQHRDNFIKLAKEGVYDNIIFHRVIRNFMIQTGDPALKPMGEPLSVDTNQYKYTVPAEIVYPRYFHRRGALAAARMGDDVNPERASSGCQFYIVTGRKFREGQLLEMAGKRNNERMGEIFNGLIRKHREEILELRKARKHLALSDLQDSLRAEATAIKKAEGNFMYTPEQIETYTKIGGTPHLDGAYTVFGQVIDGMKTVEKIEGKSTGPADRPKKDIRILKATVLE